MLYLEVFCKSGFVLAFCGTYGTLDMVLFQQVLIKLYVRFYRNLTDSTQDVVGVLHVIIQLGVILYYVNTN